MNQKTTLVQMHTVKLTFQHYKYKVEYTTTVCSRHSGLSVISHAVEYLYDMLANEQRADNPKIKMVSDDGEVMFCRAKESTDEYELMKGMLIKTEIMNSRLL